MRILSYYGFPYSDEETKQGGPISPSEGIELVRRYKGHIKGLNGERSVNL